MQNGWKFRNFEQTIHSISHIRCLLLKLRKKLPDSLFILIVLHLHTLCKMSYNITGIRSCSRKIELTDTSLSGQIPTMGCRDLPQWLCLWWSVRNKESFNPMNFSEEDAAKWCQHRVTLHIWFSAWSSVHCDALNCSKNRPETHFSVPLKVPNFEIYLNASKGVASNANISLIEF